MQSKFVLSLSLLTILCISCGSNSTPSKPSRTTVIYIPTDQGVDKAASIFTYKDVGESNLYEVNYSPNKGNSKLLVIPIWFTDSSDYIDPANKEIIREDIRLSYFGNEEQTGWESVSTYYKKDSYNKLNIIGEVSEWYECNKPSTDYYDEVYGGNETNYLVKKAVEWYKTSNNLENLKDFDQDGDGYLDGVMLIYGCPDCEQLLIKEASNLWAYAYWLQNGSLRNVNNPGPNAFFWASYDFLYSSGETALAKTGKTEYGHGDTKNLLIDAHTFIHEMGHILGLVDYYDYSYQTQPAGFFSMQDGNIGDHDAFSKIALGWVTPYVVKESCTLTFKNLAQGGECVLLSPTYYSSPFDEYILIEYYAPIGLNEHDVLYSYADNNKGPNYHGARIWHVDARMFSVFALDERGNPKYGNITNNPDSGNIVPATSNSTSGDKATNVAGSYYYNTLQLIRKSKIETYKSNKTISNSDLFTSGDVFKMSDYYKQFVNGSSHKLNNGQTFNWEVAINNISPNGEMTITVTVK